MNKSIFELQKSTRILKCLFAQRQEYAKAKVAKNIEFYLTVILFTVLSVLKSLLAGNIISTISIFLAFALLLVNKWIDLYISSRQSMGADIQQFIDVWLYSSVLPTNKLNWGETLPDSRITEIVCKIAENQLAKLRNWYEDYSSASPIIQIYYSQKENVRWDLNLRNAYRTFNIVICAAILVVIFGVFMVINPTFLACIDILAWGLPLVKYFSEIFKGLNNDINRLQVLKTKYNTIEKELEAPNFKLKHLVELQQLIYEHRKTAVLIPEWFYWNKHDAQQREETDYASEVQ